MWTEAPTCIVFESAQTLYQTRYSVNIDLSLFCRSCCRWRHRRSSFVLGPVITSNVSCTEPNPFNYNKYMRGSTSESIEFDILSNLRQRPHFFVPTEKNPYIDPCLKPLYKGHLFYTMATFFCPQGGHFREVLQLYQIWVDQWIIIEWPTWEFRLWSEIVLKVERFICRT